MSTMGNQRTLSYLAFLVVGLLEVNLQWHWAFDPLEAPIFFDATLRYLPLLALVASLLSLGSMDATLKLLSGGFVIVVILQLAYWFPFTEGPLHKPLLEGLMNGYDTAWGVMCVVVWPLGVLARRRQGKNWQIKAFVMLLGALVPLAIGWEPRRREFVWDLPSRQGPQEVKLRGAALDGDVARVRELLATGARLDAEDSGGWTPLMSAAEVGEAAVVQELLQHGASPDSSEFLYGRRWTFTRRESHWLPDDTVPTNGSTALMVAAVNGHPDVVKILLAAGADPRQVDKNGKTASELALAADQPEVVALLLQAEDARAPRSSSRGSREWAP